MKRENISRYCYYAVVIILALGIYFWQYNLGDNFVKALLDFYKTVVEVFFSNYHYYDYSRGLYVGNAYTIGRECLGLGIIALIFGCCGILSVKALKGYKRIVGILIGAAAAVISGVLANIIRIISSIYFITFIRFELIHALLGIVIYLTVLFSYYRFFIWFSNRSLDEAVGDAVIGDSVMGDAVSRDAVTDDAVIRDAVIRDSAPRDPATWDSSATWDSAGGDAVIGNSASREPATWDSAPRDSASWDSATWDSAGDDAVIGDSASWDSATWDSAGDDAVIGDSASWDSVAADEAKEDGVIVDEPIMGDVIMDAGRKDAMAYSGVEYEEKKNDAIMDPGKEDVMGE
ncbi:MAG: exosortase K [Oscillospiraceae bacterium]|nr:exosortase K [Oscillospiraceae bacterium]